MLVENDIGDVTFAHPFFFLRHGETGHNRARRFQGQFDSDLNEAGLEQARGAAEALKGQPIARIVASPLSRARVTAEIVGEALGLPVETDAGLMECHLGIYQGMVYQDWLADYWKGNFAPEGGEDFWQFRARVFPTMQRIVAGGPNTLIVAHGGLWYAARSLVTPTPDLPKMPNALPLHIAPSAADWRVTILGEMHDSDEVMSL
ncbi:histidine phosphatase family protein [Rhodobacteraceae bacterium NNCM2]|nr:histidine phosphatase family protein [Coraliihabitans acroporae]